MNAELQRFKQRNETDKDSEAYFEADLVQNQENPYTNMSDVDIQNNLDSLMAKQDYYRQQVNSQDNEIKNMSIKLGELARSEEIYKEFGLKV